MSFAVTTGSFAECTCGTAPGELIADFDTGAMSDVTTPQACVPVVVDSWAPGSLTASETGAGYVNDSSICTCSWGGVISITSALGVTMTIP